MKQMLGHDGAPTNFWRENLLTGQPLTRCPRRVELEARGTAPALELADARAYLPHYRRGFLPEAGGIADQPALVLQLLDLMETTAAAVQAKAEHLAADNVAAAREED